MVHQYLFRVFSATSHSWKNRWQMRGVRQVVQQKQTCWTMGSLPRICQNALNSHRFCQMLVALSCFCQRVTSFAVALTKRRSHCLAFAKRWLHSLIFKRRIRQNQLSLTLAMEVLKYVILTE